MAAQESEIIILSIKVGSSIDAAENILMDLFPDIKGFVDNPVVVDYEKLFTHRYTLANASTIRPIHSTNLIGSVKPEIGTTWGDIKFCRNCS